MEAENLLRRALAEGLVTPFFQPLIDMPTGRIRSVECLARIALPDGDDRGHRSTSSRSPRRPGSIVELDARMFELGMRQFAQWSAQPDLALRSHLDERLCAFAGGLHVRRPDAPRDDVVRRRGCCRSAWRSPNGPCWRRARSSSSRCAGSPSSASTVGLDDFGTGYSALAYLQRFDLTFLKIDRSFVSQLGNRRDDAVVAAVIDLAHALELRVVAEGVETAEQLAALRAMGCDRAQGFLMGRPMPPDELVALIRTHPTWWARTPSSIWDG